MSRKPSAFLLHPSASLHDTGWGHPEHQGRLRFLASTVGRDMMALHGRVEQAMSSGLATEADLLRVHTTAHVENVRQACDRAAAEGAVVDIDRETRVSDASWEAALGSVGAALAAARGVAAGTHQNAFVATRPPGHHATPDQAMGFCLFNTVAIVARALQDEGLARRVMIVDWDVHHGNGTQDVFWNDGSVYYLSLHQSPAYPGTGAAGEVGEGEGKGSTHNVPLAPGTSRQDYLTAFDQALSRAFEQFQPDFVFVSAGYDALAGDPLGDMRLEPEDFHRMTTTLMGHAEKACGGRIVALLEGGYEPKRTGLATVATVRALAGIDVADPTAPVPE